MTDSGRVLLDSTFLIQLGRGNARARRYLSSMIGVRIVGTTAVNVAEVIRRAHERERQQWRERWSVIAVWPVTLADGDNAGSSLYGLAKAGFQVQLPDALIAAVARRMGATVVTDNIKDFELLDVPVVRPA